MSDTTPPRLPARACLAFAFGGVALMLWVGSLIHAAGVVHSNGATPLDRLINALAVTASLCAVHFAVSHVDRRTLERERQEILAAVLGAIGQNRQLVTEKLNGIEWEVCERLPSALLEPDADTVPIHQNVRVLSAKR